MKKKLILMMTAATLLIASIIGGTLAAVTYTSGDEPQETPLTTRTLGVGFTTDEEETEIFFANDAVATLLIENMMPLDEYSGETAKTLYLENTGTSDEYVRIIITKHWVDAETGEKAGYDESEEAYEMLGDLSYVTVNPLYISETETSGKWIAATYDGSTDLNSQEQVIYYLKAPLKAGATSEENIFSQIKVANITSEEQNVYQNLYMEIEVTADAVQAANGAAAIQSQWGVTATLDADGSITGIIE